MATERSPILPQDRFLRSLLIYGVMVALALSGLRAVTGALLLPDWVMALVALAVLVASPIVVTGLWFAARKHRG
jgi:hypothetical protein